MKYFLIFLSVFIVIINAGENDLVNERVCPNPKNLMGDFDLEKYLGKWYQVQSDQYIVKHDNQCITTKFNLNEDGKIELSCSFLYPPTTNINFELPGTVFSNPNEIPVYGKLNVTFSPLYQSYYWILSTDYENYSVIFICDQMDDNEPPVFATASVLSRTPVLNPEVQEIVNDLIDEYLVRSDLKAVVQDQEICNHT